MGARVSESVDNWPFANWAKHFARSLEQCQNDRGSGPHRAGMVGVDWIGVPMRRTAIGLGLVPGWAAMSSGDSNLSLAAEFCQKAASDYDQEFGGLFEIARGRISRAQGA